MSGPFAGRPRRRVALPWPFVSGLAMGAAVSLRQPAILVGAVLLVLVPRLWARGRVGVGSVGLWLLGLAAVPAAMVAWTWGVGVLDLMYEQCVLFNFAYGTAAQRPDWATWGSLLSRLHALVDATWFWHLGALGGLIVLLVHRSHAKPRNESHEPSDSCDSSLGFGWARVIIPVWLITAFASSLPSLRFYNHHYYLTLAPLGLLIGAMFEPVFERSGGDRSNARRDRAALRFNRAARILLGLLLAGALGYWVGRDFDRRFEGGSASRWWARPVVEAGDYLHRHRTPEQKMFVFGWGAESDLLARLAPPAPTPHVMVLFYPELHTGRSMIAQWRDDMLADPPEWLVCRPGHDLVSGRFSDGFGWGDPQVRVFLEQVHAAYRNLYVQAARFQIGPPDDEFILIVYRKRTGWLIAGGTPP